MKAAIYRQYGPPSVVTVQDWPRPVAGANDVLIRVRAATVTSADWRIRSLSMPYGFAAVGRLAFGIRTPRQPILGSELSGDVVEVGASVRKFTVGDAVVAFTGARLGAHAEYCRVSADAVIVHKPPTLSYEPAAARAFGGTTALDFFRRGALHAGARVRPVLATKGRLLLVLAMLPEMSRAPWVNITSQHRMVAGPTAEHVDDLQTLVDMAVDGRFTPLIDSGFPFNEIAAAHARVDTGRKRGNVLVWPMSDTRSE